MDLLDMVEYSERLSLRFPYSEWDVSAKAETLAPGIDAAFAYVRDHIGYDAYAGVFRGAAITYAARAGNAADRALLLASLLSSKGIRTRFALGTLSRPTQERLLAQVFRGRDVRRSGSAVAARADDDRIHNRVFRRAKQDYDTVRATLGAGLAPVTRPSRAELLAELNPHVWVQAEVNETWIDLDPSLPEMRPGESLAAAESTLAELPPEQHQQVTVRISAEHLRDGAVTSSTLLEVTRNTVELLDTQLLLLHIRPAAASGLGAAIAGALGRSIGDHWTPALSIGGEYIFGTTLDVAADEFIAEWLEFELAWPNGRREVTRRPLLDRAGPGWRATPGSDATPLRAVARDENGSLAMQALHLVWLSGGGHNLAAFGTAARLALLHELAATPASTEQEGGSEAVMSLDELSRQVWPIVLQTFGWMISTDQILLPLVDDTPGLRLYVDSPRITVFTSAPAGGTTSVSMLDLRRDDLRAIALDPSSALTLADLKLRFGLLQGALEHEAMAEITREATGETTGVRSTSSLLAGRTLTVLRPGVDTGKPTGDGTAAIAAALARGSTVVAPRGADGSTDAWWEIAAETGDLRPIANVVLHGSGTPPLDRDNPFVIRKKMQQHGFGEQERYDIRSAEQRAKEARYQKGAIRDAEIRAKAEAEAAKYRNNLAQPQQSGGQGGGSEYGVLVRAVTVIGGIGMKILSFFTYMKLCEEIELFVLWIADGGFQAPWP